MKLIRWDYYEPGEIVSDANLRVVRCIKKSLARENTVYDVIMNCCGAATELTHQQIYSRIDKGHIKCVSCRRKGGTKNKQRTHYVPKDVDRRPVGEIYWPLWEKPPSVPTGYTMWCDRSAM